MRQAVYFDAYSGVSGDMVTGALLHAGLPFDYLKAEISKLGLTNFHLEMAQTQQHSIAGIKFEVVVEKPELEEHRSLSAIKAIIENSSLSPQIKGRAIAIFSALAEVESQMHAIPANQVHFHEVGAVDAIVDIVGACVGFDYFGIEEFYCSPLPVGSGFVKAAHGVMPVPAPATLQLLAQVGAPLVPQLTLSDGSDYPARREMVTPTGAAIVASLCRFERPAFKLEKVGYGYGSQKFAWPNALRLWLGQTQTAGNTQHHQTEDHQYNHPHHEEEPNHQHKPETEEHSHQHETESHKQAQPPANLAHDEVSLLETNLDDMSGEGLGYLMEKLLAAEALDVYFSPIQMKKNRPGVLLGVLARPRDEARLAEIILRETSAFGLRISHLVRYKADREFRQIETPDGIAQVKLKILDEVVVEAAPEYESVAAIARSSGRSWREVYEEIRQKANIEFVKNPLPVKERG